jgi:hypothetical protein
VARWFAGKVALVFAMFGMKSDTALLPAPGSEEK